ncbi:MAG: rRNA methyltransferase [Treponema sp.]|jgi:ribosomal protein RSM22 (predicted rRNA methylase)|nr:rRNA methyltransferase [Treponema sp.]
MDLFRPLESGIRQNIEALPFLVDKTFPLPRRFRAGLPRDIAELSRLLTQDRGERREGYLGMPNYLSAYLRYFLPWNVYRLSRLLPQLPIELNDASEICDLGSGPLTFAIALWISRPQLRKLNLKFRCIDQTGAVLEAGKRLFAALNPSWEIKTIRGEIRRNGTLSVHSPGKTAGLVTAVNVFNELFWNLSPADTGGIKVLAEKQARLLSSLADASGAILIVEPGIPRSGEFISLLRAAFLEAGLSLLAPCTHSLACCLPGLKAGKKSRWCHFAFDTQDAPLELHKLSEAAGIPKERAVLSFLMAAKTEAGQAKLASPNAKVLEQPRGLIKARVISDAFPVGNDRLWGHYCCCEKGLILATGQKPEAFAFASGNLAEFTVGKEKDKVSGALLAQISHR